ncbi:MAG TPA: hydrolase 2, exosortase A system-associated [Casimicrobiaceae bacterium]|nr:hydrolase 2, exosortase A system-associated [Casimicrobiaceae bacterium]
MAQAASNIAEHPFLLSARAGDCFCIYRMPADRPPAGSILHVPAFGDELNKARAMTARAARAFAALGYGVLQIDLFGCGDSAGEHREGTLSVWAANLDDAIDWLVARGASSPPLLWALRTGALLVPSLLSGKARDAPLILWQPVVSGAQYLTHLLRQKTVSDMDDAGARIGTGALRARLAAGETLEIGGYAISPTLAVEMDKVEFGVPAGYRGRIDWFEVVNSAPAALPPAASSRSNALRDADVRVECHAVSGPGFWQSVEIERCDALVEASANVLSRRESDARRDSVAV